MSRNELGLIMGIVIPNMDEGFEIKTRNGEVFRVDPRWECCQEFMSGLKAEMNKQLNEKPQVIYGYTGS